MSESVNRSAADDAPKMDPVDENHTEWTSPADFVEAKIENGESVIHQDPVDLPESEGTVQPEDASTGDTGAVVSESELSPAPADENPNPEDTAEPALETEEKVPEAGNESAESVEPSDGVVSGSELPAVPAAAVETTAEGIEADSEEKPAAVEEKKPPRRKWVSFKYGPEPMPLVPFDMHPVTDIILRRAVEEGVRNSRDLSLYKTTEEWNGYPKDTIVISGIIEEGAPFAVWDPPKRRRTHAEEKTETDPTNQNGQE